MLLAHELVDPGVTAEAQATARELAGLVEASLTKLDDPDREIILLRHYEHLSNQEVADALQLTAAAASMRYLRAIRRLREILDSDNSEN
jgi:RNA polymerase sigma-70 factor (ECF subfamily)